MSKLIFSYYGFPIQKAVGYMILLPFVWAFINYIISKKLYQRLLWKLFNAMLAGGMVVIILAATVSSRGGVSELIIEPFYSLRQIPNSPDLGRSMFMNIFIFFPLGLTLPFALPEKWNRKALIAILFGLTLSSGIEFLQYHYHLGRAETDDVLCNTLGCIVGTTACVLNKNWKGKKNERTKA